MAFIKVLNVAYASSQFFVDVGRQLIKQRKDREEKYNDFFQLLIDVERNDNVFNETDQCWLFFWLVMKPLRKRYLSVLTK